MLRHVAALLVAVGLGGLESRDLPRTVLWRVEQACMAAYRLTGSSFPCLEVHLGNQPGRGYVVLETPDRRRDIVLMPTARVKGLEDPVLAHPDAQNYFALAWSVRRFVDAKAGQALEHDEVGLAVNSSLVRSQDQFHIHLDCLAGGVARSLETEAPRLSPAAWSERPFRLRGESWFLRLVPSDSLAGLDLIAALHESPPARKGHFDTLAAGVVGIDLPGGKKGFILLAADTQRTSASPETLLDHSCRAVMGRNPRRAGS